MPTPPGGTQVTTRRSQPQPPLFLSLDAQDGKLSLSSYLSRRTQRGSRKRRQSTSLPLTKWITPPRMGTPPPQRSSLLEKKPLYLAPRTNASLLYESSSSLSTHTQTLSRPELPHHSETHPLGRKHKLPVFICRRLKQTSVSLSLSVPLYVLRLSL